MIAVNAVVHIPADVRVVELGCGPAPVAIRALEHRIVARIGVARGANSLRVAVSHGEPGVVKRGSQPIRGNPGCMASHTGGREPGRNMVGAGRCRVIGLVARVAIRGRQRVIVGHVTAGAGRGRMQAEQRPVSRWPRVIELSVCPGHRVVARIAGGGESQLYVVNRADRGGVVVYVAAGLVACPAGQTVVAGAVAL